SEKNQARYEKWFDRYLAGVNSSEIMGTKVVFLTGNDCFALRCAFLHAGTGDITEQRAQEVLEKFYFTLKGVHRIKIENTLTLNVRKFCEEMCQGVEKWLEDVAADGEVQARLPRLLQIHVEPFSPHPGTLIE